MFRVDEAELRHLQVGRDVDRVRHRPEVHRVHGVPDCMPHTHQSHPSIRDFEQRKELRAWAKPPVGLRDGAPRGTWGKDRKTAVWFYLLS